MKTIKFMLILLLTSWLMGATCQSGLPENEIPKPFTMKADILVSGHTSRAVAIDIVPVGQHIPDTFSNPKVTNTVGFSWWVSQHYAFKSNLPENKVVLYLTLLELAYPHYMELFGAEPQGMEQKRLAVIYATTFDELTRAMKDDGFLRGPNGGGETMWYNFAAYNYESAREEHQRYIVLHECTHAFQMALTDFTGWIPNWFVEGVADSLSQHVYDPQKKQLTLFAFNAVKEDSLNFIKEGLKMYKQEKNPSLKQINAMTGLKRGLYVLTWNFMTDSPERYHKIKLWRDQMFERRLEDAEMTKYAYRLLSELFQPINSLESDFAHWIADKKATIAKTSPQMEIARIQKQTTNLASAPANPFKSIIHEQLQRLMHIQFQLKKNSIPGLQRLIKYLLAAETSAEKQQKALKHYYQQLPHLAAAIDNSQFPNKNQLLVLLSGCRVQLTADSANGADDFTMTIANPNIHPLELTLPPAMKTGKITVLPNSTLYRHIILADNLPDTAEKIGWQLKWLNHCFEIQPAIHHKRYSGLTMNIQQNTDQNSGTFFVTATFSGAFGGKTHGRLRFIPDPPDAIETTLLEEKINDIPPQSIISIEKSFKLKPGKNCKITVLSDLHSLDEPIRIQEEILLSTK